MCRPSSKTTATGSLLHLLHCFLLHHLLTQAQAPETARHVWSSNSPLICCTLSAQEAHSDLALPATHGANLSSCCCQMSGKGRGYSNASWKVCQFRVVNVVHSEPRETVVTVIFTMAATAAAAAAAATHLRHGETYCCCGHCHSHRCHGPLLS
jgi:hypothetical protein